MEKFNNMNNQKNNQVKKPCVGCVYFDACGNTNRTQPCNGRVTKSDRKRGLS